jgi:hypothetical protein
MKNVNSPNPFAYLSDELLSQTVRELQDERARRQATVQQKLKSNFADGGCPSDISTLPVIEFDLNATIDTLQTKVDRVLSITKPITYRTRVAFQGIRWKPREVILDTNWTLKN